MSAQPVVWVHADCLSPHGPALDAHPGAPAIFVWDDALLAAYRISLKRMVFIYECLLELPLTIRRGDVAEQLLAFAAAHGAASLVTTESPSPRFATICAHVATRLPLRVLPVEPFVEPPGRLDLGRFSRYWRAVEADALRPRRG